jgi:hypothetical protein
MLLVWHTIGQKSRGSRQLVEWLVVRVFYCITDFMMLNTVNLSGFVTLTLRNFVTPQQVRHGLVVDSERYVFKFNLRSHNQ